MLNRIGALHDSDDRGAVLILFAIMAVVLFGFGALAVDAAHAFVQRRDSQATADVSAIAGALTLIDNTGSDTDKATALVDETMAIAARNLGPGLDWASCTDPARPGQFTVSATAFFASGDPQYTDCISWKADWSEVRVRVPTRSVDTFFAGVIGFDTVDVNAFAEVGAVVQGSGGVLPLGVLSGGTNGLVCVKTGPSFPDTCDKSATGNFDFLDFEIFGNATMGTNKQCGGSAVARLKENISHGVDHDLEIAPNPPSDHKGIEDDASIAKEDVECPTPTDDVQAVKTETGNKQKVVIDGFVEGSGGFDGRLTLGSPARQYSFGGFQIDDVALWEYLNTAATTGDPSATPPEPPHCPGVDSEAKLIACIQSNPGRILFDDNIQFSSRLAKVPHLWQGTWPTGSKYASFQSFDFVYIQTLYGDCKKSGICGLEIEPGPSGSAVKKFKNNTDPVAVTAIAIPDAALPPDVRDNFGTPRVVTYALTR